MLTIPQGLDVRGSETPRFSFSRYFGEIQTGDLFFIWTYQPEPGIVGWGFVREVREPLPVKSAKSVPVLASIIGTEVEYFTKVVPPGFLKQHPALRSLQLPISESDQSIYRLAPEEAYALNDRISEFGFRPPSVEALNPHVDRNAQPDDPSSGVAFPWQGHVTASALNLRKGPGVNFSIVTALPENAVVTVTDRDGDWLQVQSGEASGYAAAQYIEAGPPAVTRSDVEIPEISFILDLSRRQKITDLNSIPRQTAGAYVKITEGMRVDDAAGENWATAKSAGLLVGPYHVWDPDSDPALQAGLFREMTEKLDGPGDMLPVVTVEKTGESAAVQAMVEKVRSEFSRPVVIYTTTAVWNQFEGADWAAEYPLWVALYRTDIDLSDPEAILKAVAGETPRLPNSWRAAGWMYWQMTNQANGYQFGLNTGKATLSVTFAGREDLVYREIGPVAVTPPAALIPDRASFNNDIPGRIDSLNFTDYVRGFARLLTDTDVKLPIAVGLFGNWGVGKTHFINMLKSEIGDLVGMHAVDPPKHRYVRRVSQITFNAWHYIDTNLWASLAIHIFDELSREIQPKSSNYFEARRELRTNLSSSKFSKNEAETRRNQAKKERREQIEALDRCREERERKQREREKNRWNRFFEADAAALKDRRQIEKIAEQFGLERVLETADDAVLLTAELKALAGRGNSLITAFARQFSTTRESMIFMGLGLGFLALVLVFYGPVVDRLQALVPALQTLWTDSINTVMQVASLAAGVISWAGTKLSAIRTGIEKLEGLQAKLEAAPPPAEPSEEEKEFAASIANLDTEIEAAELKIRAAERTIAETQAELQRIDEGGLVYDFLNLRLHDPRYIENLGMISVIRQDLDDLQGLLKDWGSTEDSTATVPPIERILLYIDDLDRCPLDKVVEVLQAVHLLLAFELFVVVVAVDPRWLERSLLKAYVPEAGRDDRPDSFSAQNYLEKIFQIPFSIPGMTQAGFQNLVDDLIQTRREQEADAARQAAAASNVEPVSGELPAPVELPTTDTGDGVDTDLEENGAPVVEPSDGSSTVTGTTGDANEKRPAAASVEIPPFLEDREEAFLKLFGAFVETPRLTKRLVNIYRLLRFQIGFEEDRFLQFIDADRGEFLAVIMLMAMNIGYPKIGGRLMRVLQDERVDGTWEDFLKAANPASAAKDRPKWLDPTCVSDLDPAEYAAMKADFTEVNRLAAGLEEPIVIPTDLAIYRTWAVEVSRFSFDWYRA